MFAEDRLLATTNLTFDISCYEMFVTLLNGACLVLAHSEDLLDSKALETVLRDRRISVMWLSAGLFHQHAHAVPEMFAGLRCLIVGGGTIGPRAVRAVLKSGRPGMFLNGYGPTENSSLSTTYRVDDLSARGDRAHRDQRSRLDGLCDAGRRNDRRTLGRPANCVSVGTASHWAT
ncbi:Surfactin synthase subunit 2 [Streptomyces hundungensis]|uniref:Surfactin synthase subunit 2 n=2 Tax=Streptomyces hundungensis TaxID=1077946 RepID=A0A387H4R4_9ACTN|nr:Surfactin synthase subunit 2 [Streptomyces hundungensis]